VLIYSIGPCTTNLLFVDVLDVSPLSSRSTIVDQAHMCILNLLALMPVWGCVVYMYSLYTFHPLNIFFLRINKINLQAQVSMAGARVLFQVAYSFVCQCKVHNFHHLWRILRPLFFFCGIL
jgi:hypothetical protein